MKSMKQIGLLFLVLTLGMNVQAQDENKSERPSPPRSATAMVNGGEITIDYSTPAVLGRVIWGDLVPYEKVWRAGANEATTIIFQNDVTVEGTFIPAGKYALFMIPSEKDWVVIINSVWDQWGAYNYDESKDVKRIVVKPKKFKELEERLTYSITTAGVITMKWDHTEVSFNVE